MLDIIPEMTDMGLDVLESPQPRAKDVYEIKRRYGRHLRLWGGPGTQRLPPFGRPGEIRDKVARLRRELGRGAATENAVAAQEAFAPR